LSEACSTHRRGEKFVTISVGIPESKRTFARYRSIWEDNIEMNHKETEFDVAD